MPLVRRSDTQDRRTYFLTLTPAGRQLARELNAVLAENVRTMIGSWPEERVDVLIEGIRLLVEQPAQEVSATERD
jgi:DNA-binding MarR family transcriptional regulator